MVVVSECKGEFEGVIELVDRYILLAVVNMSDEGFFYQIKKETGR